MAAEALAGEGYDARILAGGIEAWVEAGLPLDPEGGYVAESGEAAAILQARKAPAGPLNTLIPVRFCYFPRTVEVVVDQDKKQHGKGRTGTLENPEAYENVPGHVIPIIEREFDDFDNEAEKFLGGELAEDQFIGFRLKQGVYGQRQPDVQMIRVKLPFGGVTPEQMEVFGQRRRALRAAQQGPRHDPPEHPDPPRAAARHREAAARDRRDRALLARGLRQHDPQRHRRPLGRRRPR